MYTCKLSSMFSFDHLITFLTCLNARDWVTGCDFQILVVLICIRVGLIASRGALLSCIDRAAGPRMTRRCRRMKNI
uniref:Uncharacterized protein n=1 Tax=Oryza glumipatula TaxID=40148 RepID=A0A0E0BNV4_9ORYZ